VFAICSDKVGLTPTKQATDISCCPNPPSVVERQHTAIAITINIDNITVVPSEACSNGA